MALVVFNIFKVIKSTPLGIFETKKAGYKLWESQKIRCFITHSFIYFISNSFIVDSFR